MMNLEVNWKELRLRETGYLRRCQLAKRLNKDNYFNDIDPWN